MFETDYLIVGAGAVGMAFADTLLTETEGTDTHITIVDAQAKPGGHWVHAYPFVTLHQPSSMYGVNSLPLGSGQIDCTGLNAGLYELATGAQLRDYYERVMNDVLLPSGRVRYIPMSRHTLESGGEHSIRSMLTGRVTPIRVRGKWVDANYCGPSVPATHKRRFDVAAGAQVVSPTGLAEWGTRAEPTPAHFCVLGGGKTAMDAANWLLTQGVQPDTITWVMPRDSWLINRETTQAEGDFFAKCIGGQVSVLDALAHASDVHDLFSRLEAADFLLRIDPSHSPGMFHFATVSKPEVAQLARITQVLRHGRVSRVEDGSLVFANGDVVTMPADTLCIDCTASAVELRPMQATFQGTKIVPQLVRAPLATLSAAMVAYAEVHGADEDTKNQLCAPVPFPKDLAGYAVALAGNMRNQSAWATHKGMRQWMLQSRLDGFGKLAASVQPHEADKIALLQRLRALAPAAMANAAKLTATSRS